VIDSNDESSCLHFYRATLCLNAVFAVVHVRPSVCLSGWLIVSTAEDIVKLILVRRGSPTLSFLIPSTSTQFQGEPLLRGRKIHSDGDSIFDWNRRLAYLGNGTE